VKNYVYGEKGEGSPMLAAKLLSPKDIGGPLKEAGGLAAGIFSATVARLSGALAASTRVGPLFIGGEKYDRLEIEVTSGEGTLRGGYGASHDFGIGIHPRSRVPPTNWMPQSPVDDWARTLAILSSMSGGFVPTAAPSKDPGARKAARRRRRKAYEKRKGITP
jgi:hypothetical protein